MRRSSFRQYALHAPQWFVNQVVMDSFLRGGLRPPTPPPATFITIIVSDHSGRERPFDTVCASLRTSFGPLQ